MADQIRQEKSAEFQAPGGSLAGVGMGGAAAARLDVESVDMKDLADEGLKVALTDSPEEVRLKGKGLTLERLYTTEGVDPFDAIEWEMRTAIITNDKGETLFRQDDCEIPKSWTQMATNVVVSKYFRGGQGMPDRETSVRQLIDRVANTITDWGIKDVCFATPNDAEIFRAELRHLLVNQLAAFNSPVWFNVGVEKKPQCSACFINSVEDSMASILRQWHRQQPFDLAFEQGKSIGRGFGQWARVVHAGIRRFRRGDQERRQDTTCGQDGHSQRRPSRYRGIHRLQGERGKKGLGPDGPGLRRILRR
jgi:hypothetical protein